MSLSRRRCPRCRFCELWPRWIAWAGSKRPAVVNLCRIALAGQTLVRARQSGRVLALSLALATAVAGMPADAVETPLGSKNFTPPADVPNYFSNESGPFQGGASARDAQPAIGPSLAAPVPRGLGAALAHRTVRHHPARTARARSRTRLAHGKASAHRQLAHAGAARGGHASGPRTAHAQVRHAAGKAVAAKTPAGSSKGKHLAAAHG